MKKVVIFLTAVVIFFSFTCCAKSENRADTSLKEGETLITGRVEETYEHSMLLRSEDGGRYTVSFSDGIQVVNDGWYVVDLSVGSFKGKSISVICKTEILETYPMQLQGERMIIIN